MFSYVIYLQFRFIFHRRRAIDELLDLKFDFHIELDECIDICENEKNQCVK